MDHFLAPKSIWRGVGRKYEFYLPTYFEILTFSILLYFAVYVMYEFSSAI
jgi:hypothetical protein